MPKKKQTWQIGDVFAIALLNGRFAIGQVLNDERKPLNSIAVALFRFDVERLAEISGLELTLENAISVIFVTRDLLENGTWKTAGNSSIRIPREMFPYEESRSQGFVGATVIGAGNVAEFMNAFFALVPWDDWADPSYLDGLLLSPARKPAKLLLKNSH